MSDYEKLLKENAELKQKIAALEYELSAHEIVECKQCGDILPKHDLCSCYDLSN